MNPNNRQVPRCGRRLEVAKALTLTQLVLGGFILVIIYNTPQHGSSYESSKSIVRKKWPVIRQFHKTSITSANVRWSIMRVIGANGHYFTHNVHLHIRFTPSILFRTVVIPADSSLGVGVAVQHDQMFTALRWYHGDHSWNQFSYIILQV